MCHSLYITINFYFSSMDLGIIKNNQIIGQIGQRKDAIVSVILFILFFAIAGNHLLNIKEPDENSSALIANPYEKYDRMLKGDNLKALTENEQFIELRYNEKLDSFIQKTEPSRRDDIFEEIL